MPRFTIWGAYQYDPTLFDDILLPAGLEKAGVIDEIMEESGDLFPYYQVPERLKLNIAHWFETRYQDFSRMYAALYAEYDPLENYNGVEEVIDTPNLTTKNVTNSTGSGSTDANMDTSAYDADDYSPENQSHSENEYTNGGESTTSETGNRQTVTRRHGNLGVTTSQQMITSELQLRSKYNMYEFIAREFERKFLCQVY